MELTTSKFSQMFSSNREASAWVSTLNVQLPLYYINTPQRISAFLAQCGHESGGFNRLVENLNYSATGLFLTFKKYFPDLGIADQYAHNPEKIANKVYANRMGNNNELSGDGWKYRGRGPIQITGNNNYSVFAKAMFNDEYSAKVMDNPDLVATDKDIAIKSAIWYWNANNLNSLADVGDIKTMTKRINGGYIGLDERIALYNKILGILKT